MSVPRRTSYILSPTLDVGRWTSDIFTGRKRIKALHHYQTLAQEMMAADADRDRMLRAMDDMWHNRWSLPDTVAGLRWIHKVVSTDPHDAIRAGRRVLSSVAPRISVQPRGPGAESRATADRIERALGRHFRNASRRRRASVLRDVVLNALLYDEVVAQVVYLPQQIEALKAFKGQTQRLGGAAEVHFDYQLDGKIGSGAWRPAGAFYSSPLDTRPVNAGQVHAIRTRLRLLTTKATAPAVGRALVLDGFARTPLRYQWTLRVKLGELQADRSGGPDAFMAWIKAAARGARKITMRAIWEDMDERYVVVEPPALLGQFGNTLLGWWDGTVTITLREM